MQPTAMPGEGHESTYWAWYERNRCPGSPKNPSRVLSLAVAIAEKDFPQAVEPDELESVAIATLTHCFATFEPAKGRPDIPIEDRFVRFFRFRFRLRLRDLASDRASRGRRKSTLNYFCWKSALEPSSRKEDLYREWCQFIYGQAQRRLSREAQRYIRLHFVEGRSIDEIAPLLKRPRRTLCRLYGQERLADIFKKTIHAMVTGLPKGEVERLIFTLYYENHFDEEQIARLLCLPLPYVVDILKAVTGKVMKGLEKDAGRRLFEAD